MGKHTLPAWLVLCTLLLLNACEQSDPGEETENIASSSFEFDFTLEPKDQLSTSIFEEEEISGAYPLILLNTGFKEDEVEAIRLKEARLEITSNGEYTDFNMLKIIELTFYNDDIRDQKVAWSNPVPDDRSLLELELTSENLIDFFKAGSFILTSQGRLRERVYEKVELKAVMTLEVMR